MGKTILIVDDAKSMRGLVGMTLRGQGYEVVEACDGKDALSRIDGQKVNMVLSDLNMPNMDGIQLIREVRTNTDHKFVPIIMLTARSEETDRIVGLELGDVAVLVESDAKGLSNWTFPRQAGEKAREKKKEKDGEQKGGLALILHDVEIENIVVTRRSPGAKDQVYRLDKFTVQADSADQMVFSGEGNVLQLPLTLTGKAGTRHALAEVGA